MSAFGWAPGSPFSFPEVPLAITETTELEAVNTCLATINESPRTSITGVDATAAQRYLLEASRKMQSVGWWFNRETVKLSPDGSGEYIIPSGVLVVTVCDINKKYFSQRAGKLFNTKTRLTTGHTEDLDLVYITGLDFEELPQEARQVVMMEGAKRFANRSVGDRAINQVNEQDRIEAWRDLRARELSEMRYNSFNDPDLYYIVNR